VVGRVSCVRIFYFLLFLLFVRRYEESCLIDRRLASFRGSFVVSSWVGAVALETESRSNGKVWEGVSPSVTTIPSRRGEVDNRQLRTSPTREHTIAQRSYTAYSVWLMLYPPGRSGTFSAATAFYP